MCKQPAIRAPFKGFSSRYSFRKLIKPGISASANLISLRPQSAKLISLTLYFTNVVVSKPIIVYLFDFWQK